MLVADMRRLRSLVDVTGRVLTFDEGGLIATYARTFSAVGRDRRKSGNDPVKGKSVDELLELASSIPELRELVGKM